MVNVLIDTSVWLQFAKTPQDEALIDALDLLTGSNEINLVVPRVVYEEFIHRRDEIIAECSKSLASHFRVVKDAIEQSGDDPQIVSIVLQHLNRVDGSTDKRRAFATRIFKRIERLIGASPLIEPSEAIKLACYKRAANGLAPFHTNADSMSDATIVETYAALVSARVNSDDKFIFVSRDVKAFSAQNHKFPHEDYDFFEQGKSDYFISLSDAIGNVSLSSPRVREILKTWAKERPTFGDLIRRFIDEVHSEKPIGSTRLATLQMLQGLPIASKIAATLKTSDFIDHYKLRNKTVSAPTIRQDFTYMRGILKYAEEVLLLDVSTDSVDKAGTYLMEQKLIGKSESRDRRPTDEEVIKLKNYFATRRSLKIPMVDLIEFTARSGRQVGEICELYWDPESNLCKRIYKKDPSKVEAVALTDTALEMVRGRVPQGGFVFPYNAHSASAAFTVAIRALEIEDLVFDDFRRVAEDRMRAAGLGTVEIAHFTGRKSLDSIHRRRSPRLR